MAIWAVDQGPGTTNKLYLLDKVLYCWQTTGDVGGLVILSLVPKAVDNGCAGFNLDMREDGGLVILCRKRYSELGQG
jgi:hypothetical protein